MKQQLYLYFALFFLLTACNTEEACVQKPCPVPNINNWLSLTLSFPQGNEGDTLFVVRTWKGEQLLFDSLSFFLGSDKLFIVGAGGALSMTEEGYGGNLATEVDFDFELIYKSKNVLVSNIKVQDVSTACECPAFQIASLDVNGETKSIGQENYSIVLNF